MKPLPFALDERLASAGDTLPLAGHLDETGYELGDHEFALPEGIDYDLVLTNAGEGILATGLVRAHVVGTCDRCLEDCRIPVDYDGRLLVRFSDEEREYDGDVLWLSPVEDEVDLMQYIYESIVLSLPYQRVHPEGECNPEMMRRFRIVSGEEFAGIEARAREQAEESIPAEGLSKLAALKAEMEAAERTSGTGKEEKQRE